MGLSLIAGIGMLSIVLTPGLRGFEKTDEGKGTPTILLQPAGEISAKCGPGPDDYFWDIDSLCFDADGALFVADRGWGKVFKLDSKGGFVKSFGCRGQGPGEFLGDSGVSLNISVGNDGFLYASSSYGASRILRFDRSGKFLDSMETKFRVGTPVVGATGELLLVSDGPELISVYRFRGENPSRTFFSEAFHFGDPFLKANPAAARFLMDKFLPMMIAENDDIVVVSNLALKAFVLRPDGREITRFDVGDKDFRTALRKRAEESVKKNPGGSILTFIPVLSPSRKLYLFTPNVKRKAVDALVYSLDGRQEAVLQIPADINMPFAVNDRGEVFGVKENTEIVRFHSPFK
ncbi:MAG: hypothetical protein JW843_06055 [Candidatus Aminicenantes bacterium]|nr:hypothetical protein [Candidatus Aminicenantes bacterium]